MQRSKVGLIKAILVAALLPLALPLSAAEVGLTRSGARISATIIPGPSPAAPSVLLIGGLDGDEDSARAVNREIGSRDRFSFRLLAISRANPDKNKLQFPPSGTAYRDNPESHALWRWIALQAPDLVLIAGSEDFGLAAALSQNTVAGVGKIPARIVASQPGILQSLPAQIPASEAHREIDRRRARPPRQFAEELGQFYGLDFDQSSYIPGMALIAQMRLGHVAAVENLAAPYADGSKDPLGAKPAAVNLAAHLVFAGLARRTRDPRYTQMVKRAADLGFDGQGVMKESMPFHEEMSDSVFMSTPLLVEAGNLTGERKYFDMAARHFAFMEKLDLRPDGIYRHSPLTDAAWGRGNAFPALGLALTLTGFPKDHPAYARLLLAYQQLMAALVKFQDEDGMWHEVVDEPGSYRETSATSMIATAMLRGIRGGWLDKDRYQAGVDRAWRAILARVGPGGMLIDVCESTGKQKTLQDYLDRAASLGKDPRGGAMAMLFATEMAGLD